MDIEEQRIPPEANLSLQASLRYEDLRRELSLAEGFNLFIAVARGHALAALVNLADRNPPEDTVLYRADASTPSQIEDLPTRLFDFQTVCTMRRSVVFYLLRGSSEAHRKAIAKSLAILNERRNQLIKELPIPIVLVGDLWLLRVMQQVAPDLWSVRSNVTFFPDLDALPEGLEKIEIRELGETQWNEVEDPADLETLAEEAYGKPRNQADRKAYLDLQLRAVSAYLWQGDRDRALDLLQRRCLEAAKALEDEVYLIKIDSLRADILEASGDFDAALKIREEKELPFYRKINDARAEAITWGKIAHTLYRNGQYEKPLELINERVLPVFQRLGDDRSEAIAWGQFANILYKRGDYDQALEIRKKRELPVFQRLGDARSEAITWGRIADILYQRGLYDEVLNIRNERELPVFQRLGDARSEATTWGKIADIFYLRRNDDKALEIINDRMLPLVQRRRDDLLEAVALAKCGDIFLRKGELKEAKSVFEKAQATFRRLKLEKEARIVEERLVALSEQ